MKEKQSTDVDELLADAEVAEILANADDFDADCATESITERWVASSTIVGTRQYQQDSVIIPNDAMQKKDKNICVLSDGMGGMQGGERASALCVTTLFNDFYEQKITKNYPEFFKSEINKIDEAVSNFTDDDGNSIESGATLVSVIIDKNNMYWASVGDSSIYIIRDDEIVKVTEDHNYYQDLIKKVSSGTITQEEADNDPSKEALTSFIGIGGIELVDINEKPFELFDGDIIVMSSDGLYRSLNEDAIKLIVNEFSTNIPLAANMLTTSAMENRTGGQDNTSVIVVKYNNN